MESLVRNFNINENFWESNPNIKNIGEFKQLYRNDKSKKKKDSSTIMWAVALFLDKNKDNPYKNLRSDDRKIVINSDFLENDHYDWSFLEDYIKAYKKYCMTAMERALLNMEDKLKERDDLISMTKYDMDNADDMDKLLLNTKKLKDMYTDIKDDLEKEQDNDGVTKGGRIESASEKGDL